MAESWWRWWRRPRLGVSFWSLMYSRTGIRHIALPWLILPCFYCFWRGLNLSLKQGVGGRPVIRPFFWAGLWLGLAFYTYFASRGVPLIFVAFVIYLGVVARPWLARDWRGLLLVIGVALFVALPLIRSLSQQPEYEGRVEELAVPVVEARAGNFAPLGEHVVVTLGMFHATGDGEYLYNIPDRPLFGPLGAIFFWGGVLLALIWTLQPLWPGGSFTPRAAAAAFLLLWWGAGISPAFLSVPPASLSHTILAQSAVYIFVALPFLLIDDKITEWHIPKGATLTVGLAAVLLLGIGYRDLYDYFVAWPETGITRFLYRAALNDLGNAVREETELTDFSVTSLLNGQWDRIALQASLRTEESGINGRLYQPERVLFLNPSTSFNSNPATLNPIVPDAYTVVNEIDGEYDWTEVDVSDYPLAAEPLACFDNGFCVITADYDGEALDLLLRVDRPLTFPAMPLISNPPPPGVYPGPRLHLFAQLLTADGEFVMGDDGLWVDVQTLEEGDAFLQRHYLPRPAEGGCQVAFGFYDPMNSERVLLTSGGTAVLLSCDSFANE